jgi:hypothetical protein
MKQVGLVIDNLLISSDANTLPVLSHLDVLTELDVLRNMGKFSFVLLNTDHHKIENQAQQIANYQISSIKHWAQINDGSPRVVNKPHQVLIRGIISITYNGK